MRTGKFAASCEHYIAAFLKRIKCVKSNEENKTQHTVFVRSAVHRLTLDVCSQQSKTHHLLLPVRLRNMSHKWHSGDSIRNKFPPTASNDLTRIETDFIMPVYNSSLYFSLKEYKISGQSGFPLAFFFLL